MPSCDGRVSTGPLRPSRASSSSDSRSMASFVAGSSAFVTTTWNWSVEPSGHFSFMRLMAWTPSIESGNEAKSPCPMCSRRTGDASASRNAGRDDEGQERAAHRRPHDAAPRPAPLLARPAEERQAEPVHVPIQDRQQRGQERQRPDDRDEHDRDRADRHRAEQRVVEQEQAADRDHHRESREEHGPARGARRRGDGGQLVAPSPFRPEARDHEQGVVDGDGEADQDHELARVRADGRDELAVQREDAERARATR